MANSKKIVQAAAGNVAGAGLNVEEIFINYLWEGNDATRTITNGIDLSNEGGMLWIKARTSGEVNWITDSERTLSEALSSNASSIYSGYTNRVTSYTSSGFTLGAQPEVNALNEDFVSWCFRKAEGFFDVVTWTGDGTSGREIAHNLGTTVGSIFVKQTDNSFRKWAVYHREMDATNPSHYKLHLNTTDARANELNIWNDTEPTSTHFTVGSDGEVNGNGGSYVAYVFAHNDGDGDFGPTGDQDIIKCGSYTGNGSLSGPSVDLGFEPQWIIIKNTSQSHDWEMYDVMRGWTSDGNADQRLEANLSAAEVTTGSSLLKPTATGFALTTTNSGLNASGNNYIYIAIRRGPMAVPESATDVFNVSYFGETSGYGGYLGAPVDMALRRSSISGTADWQIASRLTKNILYTNLTNAEVTGDNRFENNKGVYTTTGTNTDQYFWMWQRRPSFFDVVAYTGNGTAGRTVSHNLGVAPEMMWIKWRDGVQNWYAYTQPVGNERTLFLSSTAAQSATSVGYWNNTSPTSSDFTLGVGPNGSGRNYIAYLFASLDGVSKVGSFTSDGTDMTIDCGFTAGARFILLKRYNTTDDWFVWDSTRGITSGADPRLKLNSTAAEAASADNVGPDNSGFIVKNNILGGSGNDFIFYAVAI